MKISVEDRLRAYADQLDQNPVHQPTNPESFHNPGSERRILRRWVASSVGIAAVLGLTITSLTTLRRHPITRVVVDARSAQESTSRVMSSTRLAFPVAGPASFTDTKGAPRDGVDGTQVQVGADLFAPAGTKVVAIRSARVDRIDVSERFGTSLVLIDIDGNRYIYSRIDAPASGVRKGAVVPSNGSLGRIRATPAENRQTPAYLHVEIWAPTGTPVNPYTLLRALEGKRTPATSGRSSSSPSGTSILVRADIQRFLDAMVDEANRSGIRLSGGGYRSSEKQIALRQQHCGSSDYETFLAPPSMCSPPTALPGSNPHEYGIAVDFTANGKTVDVKSAAYAWLSANASKFHFFQTVPDEPWHWEYRSTT